MARNRVSSFFEKWSYPARSPTSPTHFTDSQRSANSASPPKGFASREDPVSATEHAAADITSTTQLSDPIDAEPPSANRQRSNSYYATGSRTSSRPTSMVQTYQPPLMEVANDTPPELQPIFTFLNSHSNKLYQEGYFLKLHDLDTRGRPSTDRTWQECFAQLVGTVLSLWDAAELDTAGEDGEVVPTFINLADASIRMIESLPMNEQEGQNLQNVLSISTAANNRYLLHFNSLNSLTQWTSGIRLAMYEHATLQEAYTGSLVAGKGRTLNNIKQILERNKFKHEDWARVRFGAGTPWRRCWFVVSPPDEKEWEKAQKSMKKNPYEKAPVLKGDVKFYETRKVTKRTRPIATITNAYSAYAIYPQSKPLIDQSTLVKIEGRITIHSMPETTTDGFVFVMPEVHPAISGFEMMLRFLFPLWDTFALYGRPSRLIADVLDQRGLMFAMPRDRRYGYLEILDVAGLIHSEGSANWSERQWRKAMKELTSKRMLAAGDEAPLRKKTGSRVSLPGSRSNTLRFDDSPSGRNSPSTGQQPVRRAESALGGAIGRENGSNHRRTASETPYQQGYPARPYNGGYDERDSPPPRPPPHSAVSSTERVGGISSPGRETPSPDIPPEVKAMGTRSPPPAPVEPPSFAHAPNDKPRTRPNQMPEIRRHKSDLDEETRAQMREAVAAGSKNGQAPMPVQQPMPPQHGMLGAQNGYGGYGSYAQQDPYRLQDGSREQSPSKYGGGHYNGNPNPKRLSTIPASPFVEQDSPVLDRAGAVLPPPTVAEQPSKSPSPTPNMAQAGAAAAMKRSPSNSNMQNASGSNEPRPGVERSQTFNIQRKAVGGLPGRASHDGARPQLQQSSPSTQCNPQQYQYDGAYAGHQNNPYGQAPPGEYQQHGQMPYRGPPPHQQGPGQSNGGKQDKWI